MGDKIMLWRQWIHLCYKPSSSSHSASSNSSGLAPRRHWGGQVRVVVMTLFLQFLQLSVFVKVVFELKIQNYEKCSSNFDPCLALSSRVYHPPDPPAKLSQLAKLDLWVDLTTLSSWLYVYIVFFLRFYHKQPHRFVRLEFVGPWLDISASFVCMVYDRSYFSFLPFVFCALTKVDWPSKDDLLFCPRGK